MLAYQIRAELLCFGDCDMSIEAKFTSWIVDCYQTLPEELLATFARHGEANIPLLDSQWLVFRDSQSYHFTLRIESVQINMGNDSKRACSRRQRKLSKMSICKLRFLASNRRRCFEGLGRRHGRWKMFRGYFGSYSWMKRRLMILSLVDRTRSNSKIKRPEGEEG